MESTIVISKQTLVTLMECLAAQKQFNPQQTPEQKQLAIVTEQTLSSADRLLAQVAPDVQSFAEQEIGKHTIDGRKSKFL